MVEATFALFVASGLCLTFSVITTVYAIRTLENSRQFLDFAWDLLLRKEYEYGYGTDYRKEGTE